MRGFTLIETVITLTLTVALTLVISSMLTFFYRTNASVIQSAGATTSARRGIEGAMKDLREATFAETGAYPIAQAGPNSITFYADIDTDASVEKVTYTLEGNTLFKVTQEAAGDPPTYTGSIATTTLSTNVRNAALGTNLFTYFDRSGVQLPTTPAPIDVTFVTATLTINVNPDRAPEDFTLTSSATLRNLRVE